MESLTLNPNLSSPSTPSSSYEPTDHQNLSTNLNSPSPSPSPSPSSLRLWRPQAQRNIRNQWSKLLSLKKEWSLASSSGKSCTQSLANCYLNQSYLPATVSSIDLGVLSDTPNIRDKLRCKLASEYARDQDLFRSKLLSSYKDMVRIVSLMNNASSSMRCFMTCPTGSSLMKISNHSVDKNDLGDGGRIPVFTFLSVSDFESLAQDLVEMFSLELILKRLLVVELLSVNCQGQKADILNWSHELYPGEFKDLSSSNLYSEQTCQPIPPRIDGHDPCSLPARSNLQPSREVLQVYLITWLAELNIKTHRVDEIFTIVGEEMRVILS